MISDPLFLVSFASVSVRFFHAAMCGSGVLCVCVCVVGYVVFYYVSILQLIHPMFDGHYGCWLLRVELL